MTDKYIQFKDMNGAGIRVGVVHTRWHGEIVQKLCNRVHDALVDRGVLDEDIVVIDVPGSWELPYAARHLAEKGNVDVVIPIGCLIKGATLHFEYIADAVVHALMDVQRVTETPLVLGLLTCLTEDQAKERAAKDGKDHGYEWGLAAIEMASLKNNF